MKKILALALALVMLFALFSCASGEPKKELLDLASMTTIGDFLALETDSVMTAQNDTTYVLFFQYNGVYYRVYTNLPADVYSQIEQIDFFDEQREEKINALISDLKIIGAENMTIYIPSEAELEKYVGKTGNDLLEDDFWGNGYSLEGEQVFYMGHDIYTFDVYFNETVKVSDDMMDFNEEDAIREMTVKKVVFSGFSDNVTDIA